MNIHNFFLFTVAIGLFFLVTFSSKKNIENFNEEGIFIKTRNFPNFYSYQNPMVWEFGRLVFRGVDICKKVCTGNCLEYGMTGNAYCFDKLDDN